MLRCRLLSVYQLQTSECLLMKSPLSYCPILVLLLFSIFYRAKAENWPRFHGPNGSGVTNEIKVPAVWTESDFRWRVDLPGVGHGSPVVWGDKLFLLCATESPSRKKGKGKGKSKSLVSPDGEATATAEQRWMPLCISTKDGVHTLETGDCRWCIFGPPIQQSCLDDSGGGCHACRFHLGHGRETHYGRLFSRR